MDKLGGKLPFPAFQPADKTAPKKKLKAKEVVSLSKAKESFEQLNIEYKQASKQLDRLQGIARDITDEVDSSLIQSVAHRIGLGGEKGRKLKWVQSEIKEKEGDLEKLSKKKEQIEKVLVQASKIPKNLFQNRPPAAPAA
jgi:hypothetical protein